MFASVAAVVVFVSNFWSCDLKVGPWWFRLTFSLVVVWVSVDVVGVCCEAFGGHYAGLNRRGSWPLLAVRCGTVGQTS